MEENLATLLLMVILKLESALYGLGDLAKEIPKQNAEVGMLSKKEPRLDSFVCFFRWQLVPKIKK